MKKITVTVISLSLLALLASGAMAGQWGPGRGQGQGYGMGPGAYAQLTPEQQADLQKKRAAFEKERAAYLQDTLGLRQQMTAKRQELRTLIAQPNFDKAKAKALALEMVDLRAQLAKKRIEHFSEQPRRLWSRLRSWFQPRRRPWLWQARRQGHARCLWLRRRTRLRLRPGRLLALRV